MPPPAEGFASRFVLGPALRTQPDRRLVTLVREGYELAFEEIVRRYRRPLGRYAAAIVGGRSEDVTQDAFSKALLAMRRDDCEIDLRPWLYRIVRNTALNDLRDRPAAVEELAEVIAGGRNPAETFEQREELADLMKRLQALPEPQRAAIVMRELEGLSHEEIASALGLSGGAARQAIYRARQALRDGVGMLLPLPLLKALLAGAGPGTAEAAAGVGSAAGAGVALKATAATMLVAGAVGAGIAIDGTPRSSKADIPPAGAERAIARQVPDGVLPSTEGGASEPASRSGSSGGDDGSGDQREAGMPSRSGGSSGPDNGARSPAAHQPGPSRQGGSGSGDGDVHHEVAGPGDGIDDSRHGDSGSSGDDGIDHVGDGGSEVHSGSGSSGDSGEETSGGDGGSDASAREEGGSLYSGGDEGSDGGEPSGEVSHSSTDTSGTSDGP